MNIEEAESSRGTSVESTINFFPHCKDGRSVFQALVANDASRVKNRLISKERLHLLQNINWNGWGNPLGSYVNNHRQYHGYLMECSPLIQIDVPGPEQRLECLIDSMNFNDRTL